ncbi:YceD family protein [Aurantibacillus circumpalustris]|uniref:YceD family protein n=1 Tax=Aurantibacillus circumpalustris TaxID=3036359 RepID=UPI00295B4ED1|nr:DUF177 domain-containing protein [Aurantibacillus circumpalustris]
MGKSQYIIQFGGLPVGLHDFEFDVNDSFFNRVENSEVQKADIQVDATLTKQNNLLQMHFNIYGTVGVDCDRCLKAFDFPIDAEGDLVIKHGKPEESTDEILVIPEGDEEFDVSHYLYEYIILAIPARRVPCEIDEKSFKCDYETLNKLNNLITDSEEGSESENNPMWEQLNKIKFNKN